MNNTIKQEVRDKGSYFRTRRKAEFDSFLNETIDRVREATIQECVEALPREIGDDEKFPRTTNESRYFEIQGYETCIKAARTTLLALKNKNIDV